MCSVAMFILLEKPLVEQYGFRALVQSHKIPMALFLENMCIYLYEKQGYLKRFVYSRFYYNNLMPSELFEKHAVYDYICNCRIMQSKWIGEKEKKPFNTNRGLSLNFGELKFYNTQKLRIKMIFTLVGNRVMITAPKSVQRMFFHYLIIF